MKPFSLLTALGLSLCAAVGANAQDRDIHSERLVLDNDAGNTATIQTPTLTQPATTLTIPDPGAGAASFLLTESAATLTVGSDMTFTGTLDFTGATIIGGGGTPQVNASLIGDGTVGTPLGINLNNANTWTAAQTFLNNPLAIANNDNTARELRLLEPSGSGVNYSAFKAQAQAGDLVYTLPNAAPTGALQVLQVQAVAGNNATLSWATIGGGAILFARTGVIANAGNTSYNVQASDDIVGVDMSAGTNFTVNLPPATTAGEILIVKIEQYNNTLLPVLTIQPSGTDDIDGFANDAFGNAGGSRSLYSDGAGSWYTW